MCGSYYATIRKKKLKQRDCLHISVPAFSSFISGLCARPTRVPNWRVSNSRPWSTPARSFLACTLG